MTAGNENPVPVLPERPDVVDAAALAEQWGAELHPYGCPQCGVAYLVPADSRALVCPACHAAELETQPVRLRAEPPELVLPFSVSREQLTSRLQNWVRRVRLRPDDLQPQTILERLTRTYLPMWLVDGTVTGSWQAEVGFNYEVASAQEEYRSGQWHTRKVTETRIRWEPRVGALQRSYDNRLAPALADHAALTRQVGDFDFKAHAAYNADAVAGASVRVPDLPPEEIWHLAQPTFDRAAADDCRRAGDAQHIRDFQIDAQYTGLNWTQLLLPVYTSYYCDDDGNVIPVMIHGQSGQVSGVLRASLRKGWIWGGVLAGVALGLFLLGLLISLLTFVLPPILALGAVFLVGSAVFGVLAVVPVIYAWRWNARHKILNHS